MVDREVLLLVPDDLPVLLPPLDLPEEDELEEWLVELCLSFLSLSFSWAKTPAKRVSSNTAAAMPTHPR